MIRPAARREASVGALLGSALVVSLVGTYETGSRQRGFLTVAVRTL